MKRWLLPLLLCLPLFGMAGVDPCLPEKPKDQDRLVFQFTPFLEEGEEMRLNGKLTQFARETSNRIAIVVVDDLCGYEVSDYAFDLGENWGIGAKGKDNGLLVVVKPTGTPGQRKIFIATGYGLEGPIPDLMNKRIVEDIIIPHFKQHEFYAGLDLGTDALMKLARSEFNEQSLGEQDRGKGKIFPVIAVLLIIVLIFWMRRSKVKRYARTNGIDFWSAWWLLNQAGRSHRGSWGGFSGGGGGFSGGGGFGGFGGGSFGGGGAGGSW